MNKTDQSNKSALVRESLVFQVKLIADGFRDFALVPISLIATAIGLIRGGDSPDTEFRRVIEIGQKTDQWINLFGTHEPLEEAGRVGSIDMLLTEAEEVVRRKMSRQNATLISRD
jgi:hypothetical protein